MGLAMLVILPICFIVGLMIWCDHIYRMRRLKLEEEWLREFNLNNFDTYRKENYYEKRTWR